MCGIAGIYNTDGKVVDLSDLKKMSDIIAYRGPDDFGYLLIKTQTGKMFHFKDNDGFLTNEPYDLGFAHRRLSIIDLSINGHQPMCNEDATVWLIYNGEIYNYQELALQLKSLGHNFKSKTDSEVIIHAYEQWGLECFKHFNGMWAIALWDSKQRSLILSRDRLGVKPLYYTWIEGVLLFASEIKSLLVVKRQKPRPDMKEIYKFLKFGLIDATDATLFESIRSVPSGHYLIVKDKTFKSEKHWDIICNVENRAEELKAKGYAQITNTFRELFIDSVRLRLRSDVPVGVCLSGGMDSSSIAYTLASFLNKRLSTFSSFYNYNGFNEETYIDTAAKDCSSEHFKISPDGKDFMDITKKIVWHLDQPAVDCGVYSMWHVMKLAQPKVKVLLDGQGGDELLGGYFLFWHVYLKSMLLKSPFQFFKDVYKISQINSVNPLIFIARALVPYCGIQLGRNIKTRFDSIFTSDFRTYGERFKKEFFSGEDIFGEPVKNIMFNALRSFMLPNLLRNEDRISMAFSLESRLPFLDYRIIEFCFAMPTSMKFKGAVSKALLRDTMQGVVNSKILNRFDKMGFPTPAKRWYRQYHKDEIMDIIESEEFRTRGIFDTKRIRIFIKGFFDGRYDINSEISRIIMLDIWFRLFIEN